MSLPHRTLHVDRSASMAASVLAVASAWLVACSDRPFAATDPEVFTSADYARPWTPSEDARDGLGSGVGAMSRSEPMPLGVDVGGGRQSLLRLVDVALANRPQTRGAWEEARQAAAEYGIVQGAWLPTVGLEADFYYAREIYPATGEAFFVEQVAFIPQIALNYLLLDFGRREADDDRARAALWAANLSFNRALQEAVHAVQVGYFNLDTAIALNQAAQRNLELAETVVAMVEQQLEVGLATMPSLLLARQDLAQARFDLEATVAGISIAKSNLLVACGLSPTLSLEIEPITEEELPAALAFRVEDVIDEALVGRPDLAASVARLRAAEAAIRRAEAEFMPTVTAQGSVGVVATTFETDTSAGQEFPWDTGYPATWSIGLTGEWLLFEGFERTNAVRAARAARNAAEAELRALRLEAIGQTWNAYFSVQAAVKQYQFGIALVESSEEAFAAVEKAYSTGLATITELVQAERDLQEARSTLVSTRASLLVASADLALAAGSDLGRYDADAPPRAMAP
jgi:outer membrane protein